MTYVRKILALLLAFCLLLSLSTAAFARDSDDPTIPPAEAINEDAEETLLADEEAPSTEAPPDAEVSQTLEDDEAIPPDVTDTEEPTETEETPPASEIAAEESTLDAPIESETTEATTGTEESSELGAEEASTEEATNEEPPEPEESVAENGAEAKATGVPIIHGKGVRVNGTLTIGYYSYLDGAYRTAYIQAIEQKTINGAVVYCLEPEKGSTGQSYTQAEQKDAWNKLSMRTQYAIGVALAYGYPNQSYSASPNDIYWYGNVEMLNAENYIATQLIIWEILSGVRSNRSPYALTGATSYRNAFDVGWDTIRSTYDAIVAKMAKHNDIPAYASRSQNAYVYELQYDSSTGTYRYMLPAERQSDWRQCRMELPDGISYLKAADGQTVVGFEATVEAAMALPAEGYTVTGQSPYLSVEPDTAVVCWTCSGSQTVATMPAGPDPARAYFTLKADVTGSMTARKTSPSGDVEGYCFKIYHWGDSRTWYGKSDAVGALYLTDKEYNQSGNRVYAFNGLIDGDYTFLEQLSVFGAGSVFPASWQIRVTNAAGSVTFDRTFTQEDFTTDDNGDCRLKVEGITGLTGGGSMEMVITNAPLTRPVSVMKIDENGEPVLGARLQVLDGKDVVDDWVSDGRAHEISGGLLIGKSYTLHEVEAPKGYRRAEDVTFTVRDTDEPQEIVMVDPLIGGITVQKADPNDEPLSGATFLLEYSTNGGASWTPVRPATEADNGVGTCSTVAQDGTVTTGDDGKAVFADLTVSGVLYRLTETRAPAGFQLLAEPVYTGAIAANQERPCELYFKVVNVHLLQMPPAGGDGSVRLIGAIAAATASAALLGLGILLFKRRKPPESVE